VRSPEFVIARNDDARSRLPYLLYIPIDDGLVLKAKDAWPRTARVFCAESSGTWPDDAEVIERVPVRSCRRRGVAIDLVLDRARENRSQFVFTTVRGGHPAIFWQTPRAARGARPGVRVPARRASGQKALPIVVDTRERYGYRFARQQATTERTALSCGDYAVFDGDGRIAGTVERKTVHDLAKSLVDGSLAFALAELSELPRSVVVVEDRYEKLLGLDFVEPGFVLDLLARVQVRYPDVPIVFAGSRKLGEEYTFRFLGAVCRESSEDAEPSPDPVRSG
jgi:ERCC4 domain